MSTNSIDYTEVSNFVDINLSNLASGDASDNSGGTISSNTDGTKLKLHRVFPGRE